MFWHATKEVARKEFMQHIRSTRLIVVGLLFAISLIVTTIVFPVALGFDEVFEGDEMDRSTGAYEPGGENIAMAFFLTIPILGGVFFMQVLAIIMTSDAVCSEWHNRSIFLLLSKPVPRGAFLLGKFLGSVVPLVIMVAVLMIIDYLVLLGIFPGETIGRDWGHFFGGLGMIVLGLTVFATMGLFFSTLTRSTLASLFMTFGVAFLALPLVGLIGEINLWTDQENLGYDSVDPEAVQYDWSRYFNPGSIFTKATEVIAGEDFSIGFSFLVPTHAPNITWLTVVAGLGFAALFYAGAWVVVQTRNFE